MAGYPGASGCGNGARAKPDAGKIELHRRFALAIDEAAMRDGADSIDDYLADWRRAPSEDCSDDLQAEAEAKAKAIEAEVDNSALAALVAAGGHHPTQD